MLVKDKEEGSTHRASSRAARGLQKRPDRSILGCPGAGAGAGVGGGLDTTSGAREEATVRAGGSSVRVPRPPAGLAGRRRWGLRVTDEEEEKVDAAAGATIVQGAAVAADGGEEEGGGGGLGASWKWRGDSELSRG